MLISAEDECRSILTILLLKNKIFERHIAKSNTTEKRIKSIGNLVKFTQAAINRINAIYIYLPPSELRDKIPLTLPILQMNVNIMSDNLRRFGDENSF